MAHATWTYLANDSKIHKIGIFHGQKTGHVLIHVNKKVMTIDFGVRKTKTYTFFINEEVCQISILKEYSGYAYQFTINNELDTPLNRRKKEIAKKDIRHSFIFIGFVVLLTIALLFSHYKHKKDIELEEKQRLEIYRTYAKFKKRNRQIEIARRRLELEKLKGDISEKEFLEQLEKIPRN